MGRWEPDAAGRLREAALVLFTERGYEQTTVADIAEQAGVTPRTFFRYYPDKREVLFGGSGPMREAVELAVAQTPDTAPPIEVARAALHALAGVISTNREWSRRRQAVIMANAELHERELAKLAGVATTIADGLRARHVPDEEAALTGEVAMVVLRRAFERWVSTSDDADLRALIDRSLDLLRSLAR